MASRHAENIISMMHITEPFHYLESCKKAISRFSRLQKMPPAIAVLLAEAFSAMTAPKLKIYIDELVTMHEIRNTIPSRHAHAFSRSLTSIYLNENAHSHASNYVTHPGFLYTSCFSIFIYLPGKGYFLAGYHFRCHKVAQDRI